MRVGDAQSVDKCEPSRRSYARVVRRACERVLADDARGWQEHLAPANDDAPGEVVFYCPVCAAREFHSFD